MIAFPPSKTNHFVAVLIFLIRQKQRVMIIGTDVKRNIVNIAEEDFNFQLEQNRRYIISHTPTTMSIVCDGNACKLMELNFLRDLNNYFARVVNCLICCMMQIALPINSETYGCVLIQSALIALNFTPSPFLVKTPMSNYRYICLFFTEIESCISCYIVYLILTELGYYYASILLYLLKNGRIYIVFSSTAEGNFQLKDIYLHLQRISKKR